jgi:hypothetical protein
MVFGPATEWLGLKLEAAAYAFGATLMRVLGDAMNALKGIGNNLANDLLKSHPFAVHPVLSAAVDTVFPKTEAPASFSDRAKAANEKASGVDTSAMMEKSFSLISESMAQILEGMSARFDAFQSGTPYAAADGGDIGRTIADSFIERLAAAAGSQAERGNVNTNDTPSSGSGTDTSGAINKLEAILSELQRINTQ